MSINIDQLFPIVDAVIGQPTTAASLAGMFLTKNPLVPNNDTQRVLQFINLTQVGQWFGTTSDEYLAATNYFKTRNNADKLPNFIWFGRYIDAAMAPTLTGGVVTATLTDFQNVVNPNFNVITDGYNATINIPSLAAATSFSQIASIIQTTLRTTTTPDLTLSTVNYDAVAKKFTFSTGELGSAHTLTFSPPVFPLMGLMKFGQTDGGFISQGSDILSPADNMNLIDAFTNDWASFTRIFDTSSETDYVTDLALCAWTNSVADKYKYVPWFTDVNLATPNNTNHIMTTINNLNYANILPVYNTLALAAFTVSLAASTDYTIYDGSIGYSFKQQDGLTPTVTDTVSATTLLANGVSFYGAYKSTATQYRFFQDGSITGEFGFGQNFDNQYYLRDQLENTMATLFGGVNKISDDNTGLELVKTSIDNMMIQALNNGVCETGVSIDDATALILKQQAGGIDIAPQITKSGYYYQITPNTLSAIASKLPVNARLWYINGGVVNSIQHNITYIQ